MDTQILPYHSDSSKLFSCLAQLDNCVWLDSGKPSSSMGRYDILTALPSKILDSTSINGTRNTNEFLASKLNKALESNRAQSGLPFCGGWIGYISYRGAHGEFNISSSKSNTGKTLWFAWFDWAVVVDHHLKKTTLLFLNSCSAQTKAVIEAHLLSLPPLQNSFSCSPFKASQSATKYQAAIKTIQAYLTAGDCYQVNYTQRFSASFDGAASSAYLKLRKAVPSPFSAFLQISCGKAPESAILSISPERFIQISDGNNALTQPIKGTIQRGSNPKQDLDRKETLRNSKKDLAENVMIVDLLRNDFNRHCEPFSVKTPTLFEVQSFANVHHLVSTVIGKLKAEISHIEFILSCFPGGSITGAPKKRAMEVIEELELHSRGVYCGAIGYLSCNNKTDFNIAIRTLQVEGSQIYGWAGGGIVLDSSPEKEYQESLDKIGTLLKAIEPH